MPMGVPGNCMMVSLSSRNLGSSFRSPHNLTSHLLQTEIGSSGRYTLIVLASNDLLDPCGLSHKALQSSSKILDSFPAGVIDLVVLQPLTVRFEWTHLPSCVKELAEMKTYSPAKREDAYEIYGIEKGEGALVVVRPDGYVGVLGGLDGFGLVEGYFEGCLRRK
jgi:phenol 2-monooxygenase